MTANTTLITILNSMEDDTNFTVQQGDIELCKVYYDDGIYIIVDVYGHELFTSDDPIGASMFIENMDTPIPTPIHGGTQ